MIKVNNISKIYKNKRIKTIGLRKVSISFPNKGLVAICGESGSGKTTLLNCIGGLENYLGQIQIGSKRFNNRIPNKLRRSFFSFVFQDFFLDEELTVYENIKGLKKKDKSIYDEVLSALKKLGIEKLINRKISTLSGGQKQRVAIARCLFNNPKVILADEPTAHLDSQNRKVIFEILKSISKDCLVILVTHEKKIVTEYADRVITLEDGKIVDDTNPYEFKNEEDFNLKTEKSIVLDDLKIPLNIIKSKKKNNLLGLLIVPIALIFSILFIPQSTASSESDFLHHHRNTASIDTLGYRLTEEDYTAIKNDESVAYVSPFYDYPLPQFDFDFDFLIQQRGIKSRFPVSINADIVPLSICGDIIYGRKPENPFECVIDEDLANKMISSDHPYYYVHNFEQYGVYSAENFINVKISINKYLDLKITGVTSSPNPCLYLNDNVIQSIGYLYSGDRDGVPIISSEGIVDASIDNNEIYIESSYLNTLPEGIEKYTVEDNLLDVKGGFTSDYYRGVVVNDSLFNKLIYEKCIADKRSINIVLKEFKKTNLGRKYQIRYLYDNEKVSYETTRITEQTTKIVFLIIGLSITMLLVWLILKNDFVDYRYDITKKLVFGASYLSQYTKFLIIAIFKISILSLPIYLVLSILVENLFSHTGALFNIFNFTYVNLVTGIFILYGLVILVCSLMFIKIFKNSIASLKKSLDN